jgi:hypothetical protein
MYLGGRRKDFEYIYSKMEGGFKIKDTFVL